MRTERILSLSPGEFPFICLWLGSGQEEKRDVVVYIRT